MFNANDFEFIGYDSETEEIIASRTAALKSAVEKLERLNAYSNLKKGDKIIHVREGFVSQGAGMPNMQWVPIITVEETVITRINPKTYSFEHSAGYRTSYSGKYIKDYKCGGERRLDNGWRDTLKAYIIRNSE